MKYTFDPSVFIYEQIPENPHILTQQILMAWEDGELDTNQFFEFIDQVIKNYDWNQKLEEIINESSVDTSGNSISDESTSAGI